MDNMKFYLWMLNKAMHNSITYAIMIGIFIFTVSLINVPTLFPGIIAVLLSAFMGGMGTIFSLVIIKGINYGNMS